MVQPSKWKTYNFRLKIFIWIQCSACAALDLVTYKILIHKLSGTVNAWLLEYTVMDASVLTVITMLRMRLQGKQLLKVFWSATQMHSNQRLPAAHLKLRIMGYVNEIFWVQENYCLVSGLVLYVWAIAGFFHWIRWIPNWHGYSFPYI